MIDFTLDPQAAVLRGPGSPDDPASYRCAAP